MQYTAFQPFFEYIGDKTKQFTKSIFDDAHRGGNSGLFVQLTKVHDILDSTLERLEKKQKLSDADIISATKHVNSYTSLIRERNFRFSPGLRLHGERTHYCMLKMETVPMRRLIVGAMASIPAIPLTRATSTAFSATLARR